MYSTSEYATNSGKKSPRFYVGWNKAKVESIEIKSATTGRKRLLFYVYGEPITEENFKPFKKQDGTDYHGQSGRIQTNYFLDDNSQKAHEEFGNIMKRVINPLTESLGVKAKLDEATQNVSTLEQLVAILSELVCNEELPYIWMNFNGEEYEKPGSPYPGYNLFFRTITNRDEVKDKIPAGTMKSLVKAPSTTVEDEPVF